MCSKRIAGLKSSAIRDILKVTSKKEMISFAGGLPGGSNAKEILLKCLDRNVAFVPEQKFSQDASGENTTRLNFSNAAPENIERDIRKIGEVLSKK